VSNGYYGRLRGYYIPFELSRDEAAAFAQFVKRVDYDTCTLFASKFVSYSCCAEAEVMSSAVGMVQGQLAEAGLAPRRGEARQCLHAYNPLTGPNVTFWRCGLEPRALSLSGRYGHRICQMHS
jgi:hypothetical protein